MLNDYSEESANSNDEPEEIECDAVPDLGLLRNGLGSTG